MQDDPVRPATASPRPAAVGQRRLGDFVLEREIGRGGMGVVWLATQQSIHRRVALKVLPNFAAMDPAAVARFQREAAAAGRLAHQGIVPIHGVGEADGIHYYAMEWIDGPTLSQWIDHLALRAARRLKASLVQEVQLADRYPALLEPAGSGAGNRFVRSCARLCADLASALAVAHRNGVIHRDLKPSNILIHPAGRPVLVDFGLARDERAAGLTLSGDQIGTPSYMAPEQASGRRRIDARVDVYGLGAVLYELLTLRPPYDGGTSAEIAHRILTEEVPLARERNPNVPIDLAAVVHTAMARDVEQRYPAIEAFELDLRHFLDGRPVSARLPGPMQRAKARLQRNSRTLLIGGGAGLAALAIAFAAGIVNDRGDVLSGEARLSDAREQLLEHGEPELARNLYEQALALTKQPAMVRAQRQRDFRAAFERFYPARGALLRRFASTLDAEDRAALGPLLEQLDGRGSLGFANRATEQATRQLSVRLLPTAADGRPLGDLPAQWRLVRAGERLPIGECLVRAERRDGAVAMTWQRLLPDQELEIQPVWFAAAELPPDAVACQDPRTNDCFAVARHEVTRAQWRDWLASLDDAGLRAAMQPRDWDGGAADPGLPVRGLSFQQARAYAALHGGHLPSNREHWLAATAGLRGLSYPWGRRFDAALVAADPFGLSQPEPVDSRANGASPLGVLHLLGNVAEIQSPLGGDALVMGGGHFLDDPRTLRLGDESVPTAPLADAFTADAYAGMRFYRFLERDDGGSGAEQLRLQREERRASTEGCVFHDWSIEADGKVRWQVEQDGICAAGSRRLQLELQTPGFLARDDSIAVLDGHGEVLPHQVAPGAAGALTATAELPAVLRPGQGYRLRLQAELEPLGGLLPQHDVWRLQLPLQRGRRLPALHTLQLPAGARLIAAAPLPTTSWRQHRLVLTWDQTGSRQDETAVVTFRLDGSLSRRWPLQAGIDDLLAALVPAWNARSPALAALLDPAFLLLPAGRDRDQVLHDGGLDRLQHLRCVDFACAGDIGTAEVVADWEFRDRDGEPLLLPQWHLLLQWRMGGAPAVLRLMPRAEADQGSCRNDAGYVHPGMRVRIDDIPGTGLRRTQEQLVGLQVELRPEAPGPLQAQVLGHFADPAESAASIRFRLTAGAATLRQGRLLGEREQDGWQLQDWLFADADGGCRREQWRLHGFGRRHLLLRLTARGGDAEAATAAFTAASAQAWFDAVNRALHVD